MNQADLDFDADGLIPAVVQDALTDQVRMVGWMNVEAIDQTIATGQVHFWSRSRGVLWRKGETSGNVLELVDISADCDRDTLLVRATPIGPTCHTGTETCFGDDHRQGFAWLEHLDVTVVTRIADDAAGSYTAALARQGVDGPARKVLEEAGEVVLAAKNHAADASDETARRLEEESADVIYHLMVLLAERGIEARAVIEALRRRQKPAPWEEPER